MPRFQNEEPRVRGFNANKIVLGPGEVVEITLEDIAFLKQYDTSFVEVLRNGNLRDLDNACTDITQGTQPLARPANKPSTDVSVVLAQLNGLTDVSQLEPFLRQLPPLSAEDTENVKRAVVARQAALTSQDGDGGNEGGNKRRR